MSNYMCVVKTTENVVDEVDIFVGVNGIITEGIHAGKGVSDCAELHFVRICRQWNPSLSDEEIEELLDDGWFEFNSRCVCITEPFVQR